MIKFCKSCGNILIYKSNPDSGLYEGYCETPACMVKFAGKIGDILLSSNNVTRDEKTARYTQAAIFDETYPGIRKTCGKCGSKFMRYYTNQDTIRRTYVCPKCKTYW